MSDEILFSVEGQVGLVTLNRPTALNALNLTMLLQFHEQLRHWKKDDHVKAVVVRAVPGNAFCAGGDVRMAYNLRDIGHADQLRFFWEEYQLNYAISQLGKPYIALMDGITMGGGVGISLHGSHPVASERFVFAMPETTIGLFPDIGASFLLNRIPGALGVYLGLTGARLGPQDAMKAGLIKQAIASDKMHECVEALTYEELSEDAFGRVDACIQHYVMSAVTTEKSQINPLIDTCFSKSSVEAIITSLQQSDTEWAKGIYDSLHLKSPLSLKVTFAQLQKAKGLSLADCLKMDYDLMGHFLRGTTFYEGVRALLVDKDKNPQWDPARLDLVSDEMVASYFQRLGAELELC
jgi:enoyl-CoA hydratase/carnithine racemase